MPEANKLTVHILAAMAEHEREQISKRTKDALVAAKRRGKRLGNPDVAEVAKRGRAALKANARRFAANVRPIIDEIVRSGTTSHNAIAAKLNEAMCAQREEEHGRMYKSGRFCTLSAQAHLQPHEALKAAQIQIDSSPLVVVLLEHRPLSSAAYPLKLFDELIIGRNRSLDRNLVGIFEANGLQQFPSDILQ